MRMALAVVSAVPFISTLSAQQPEPARVTILYDAFGKASTLKRGWGYSTLIEYGGKRIPGDDNPHRAAASAASVSFCTSFTVRARKTPWALRTPSISIRDSIPNRQRA